MREHQITFTFSGWAADSGRLDGSDADYYVEAARQILALNAYFYTTGKVPNGGALNQTKYYRVWKAASDFGSYADSWIVTTMVLAGAAGTVLGEYIIRAADYTYEHLLRDNLGSIIRRKPSNMPLEMRREPVFSAQDRGNEPVFDMEPERDFHWRQLRERSTIILPKVARPVGRSATRLVVSGEQGEIGTIDVDTLRKLMADAQAYKDAVIASALDNLGLRKSH